MYNIEKRKDELYNEMLVGCKTCGFIFKCEGMTNSETSKCFYSFIERKVIDYLIANKMNIDKWTWHGKMPIESLVHLLIYLENEKLKEN